MCKSVPQIDAAFTRTSTSVGPIAGTCAGSIESPRAACIFRNAFIVVVILSAFGCIVLPTRAEIHASTGPSSSSSVRSVTLWQILLLLALFRASLVHPYLLPRSWILFVQLRRFRNQLLHSRPFHIRQTP